MPRILFIDDDSESVEFYRVGLDSDRCDVDVASTAFDAQAVIRTDLGRYDLLILDLSMVPSSAMPPDQVHRGLGTGVVLYREIRARAPTVPVIVLTNVFSKAILRDLPPDEPGRYKLLNKIDTVPQDLAEEVKRMLAATPTPART